MTYLAKDGKFLIAKEHNTNLISLVNETVMMRLTELKRKGKKEQK